VALSHQLRSQAPAGTIGYRLILFPVAPGERRRLVPRKREGEARGFWRLDPLQLPDDPRLQAGQVYRIRWVCENGQKITPTPGAGVAALYYFPGPADCSGDPLDDELQALLALTADRPEHAELRASLKELERVRRRQERRAARQERERGIDWAALAPLMNAVVAALGEAGCAYYELRAAFEELERQGKPAPLMLVVAQRFLEALKAQIAVQSPGPAAPPPAMAFEQATDPAPQSTAPGCRVWETKAERALAASDQPEPISDA
jgi:hypothetical protein